MRTAITTLLYFILSYSIAFCNGIGIVDGSQGIYLTVKETNTIVQVKDQIAITTTTQILQNNTGAEVNIKYGYPLNENANPIGLRWNYDNEWNEASVNSLPQDNSIPGGGSGGSNIIKQELKDYLGDNPLFFSPNDTIAIGSTIILEITYVELLPYFLGEVTYEHKNDISSLQSEIVDKQSFTFSLESEKEILSIELDDQQYTSEVLGNATIINYSKDEAIGDFDYLVSYKLSSDALGINTLSTSISDSLFSCDSLGNGYFSMIIEPESNVDTEIIEKNFSLIIDRSGSMSGDKIVQAKDAATFIIQNLNLGDYFNIIDFSSNVTSFSEELVEYNMQTESEALAYIDNIQAGGSTNISESLITSINQFNVVQEDKANIIIFCTDGNATAGEQSTNGILSLIESEINLTEKEVFLFTIGIGEDLDQALLTLLARENSGLVQFIDPETLQEDLVKFFLSINNPVLLNTEITFTPNSIEEIYPFPYPNLYKGQQLILSGRYNEADTITVNLTGKSFNVPVNFEFQISLSDSTNNNLSFLPKLWAKQKLDALSLDFYLGSNSQEQDSITALIDSLSTCYGVVAVEFSSFDDTTTEVDEVYPTEVSNKIEYYPNPFDDKIHVDLSEIIENPANASYEIYSQDARLLIKSKTTLINGILTIDNLGLLQEGVYFLFITINSQQYIVKIVK